MGQKVNPKSLRIGINKGWKSKWFSNLKKYKLFLDQDIKIRETINHKYSLGTISEIRIERQRKDTLIKIYTARPGVVIGRSGKGTEELSEELAKKIPGFKAKIEVFEVAKSDSVARIIAENVAYQIEKRVNYRRAVKQAIDKAKETNIAGIRIRVSGRLNNVDIARSEVFSWGSIPSQTLKANVDLAVVHAKTATAGTIGVKVYTYKKAKVKNAYA